MSTNSAIHNKIAMISLLATASSALLVSPSARTAAAYRCGDVRMQVAPGTKLLVIGGNGYVGREVCKNAVQLGYAVTSLSRRGECPDANDPFLSQVDWRAGNALDKPTVKAAVGEADAGMP
jgi:NADPH:quinone reductase-like Zn-dependent oxidoreductase